MPGLAAAGDGLPHTGKESFMKIFKRIVCILGVVFLAGIYICTLIFSFTDQTQAKSWLSASIYATVAVPVFLYAFLLITKQLDRRGERHEKEEEEKGCSS